MEEQKKQEFLRNYFDKLESLEVTSEETKIIEFCVNYIKERFSGMKYILGTGLDFIILAQQLSNDDPSLNEFRNDYSLDELFKTYNLVESRGQRKANTLSLSYKGGKAYGIRKIEEHVLEFFHSIDRTDYPSAYVYNTGQWQKYQDLLENAFKLSSSGRYRVINELLNYGIQKLTKNTYYNRKNSRVRLFDQIIKSYTRGSGGENGGLIFQAIAFGYYTADFPHLSIVVDKVRTGSSRQKRFGDIDCYFGLDLEISIEVKDFHIDINNYKSQLSSLIQNIQENDVIGVAFIQSTDKKTFELLNADGVSAMTQNDLLFIISFWDWQKQNNAVQAVLHYLAHIEQNPDAVKRLLDFIETLDPGYDTLEFIK